MVGRLVYQSALVDRVGEGERERGGERKRVGGEGKGRRKGRGVG